MIFGALGDIHGAFVDARRVIERHPDAAFWLSVGDIASDDGRYEPLGAAVFWIHGNNENFDRIASAELPDDLKYIRNGTAIDIESSAGPMEPLRVVGLGGTFAPTWYETAPNRLPHPQK